MSDMNAKLHICCVSNLTAEGTEAADAAMGTGPGNTATLLQQLQQHCCSRRHAYRMCHKARPNRGNTHKVSRSKRQSLDHAGNCHQLTLNMFFARMFSTHPKQTLCLHGTNDMVAGTSSRQIWHSSSPLPMRFAACADKADACLPWPHTEAVKFVVPIGRNEKPRRNNGVCFVRQSQQTSPVL